MKVSVCITTFNEKKEDVDRLINALLKQTLLPNEIIIVDASTNPIYNLQFSIFNQFPNRNFQLIQKTGVSRAEGRNIAIKIAKNEIIAITDVGCLPKKDWLEKITKPLKNKKVDVVAGFYKMTFKNNLQKAMRVFLGVMPEKFSENFLPSARSMAFTKSIWKTVGGFPENLNGTAEDTLFNVNLIKAGARFTRVKNAIVEWRTPDSIFNFQFSIFNYAKGDGQAGIWWHPIKGIQSHNIKILSIYLRYAVLLFLFFNFKSLFLIFAFCYLLYTFLKAGVYGPLLQFVSDFAVMIGFLKGLLMR